MVIVWSLLTERWFLLPLWGVFGALAKETFAPLSMMFAFGWWIVGGATGAPSTLPPGLGLCIRRVEPDHCNHRHVNCRGWAGLALAVCSLYACRASGSLRVCGGAFSTTLSGTYLSGCFPWESCACAVCPGPGCWPLPWRFVEPWRWEPTITRRAIPPAPYLMRRADPEPFHSDFPLLARRARPSMQQLKRILRYAQDDLPQFRLRPARGLVPGRGYRRVGPPPLPGGNLRSFPLPPIACTRPRTVRSFARRP